MNTGIEHAQGRSWAKGPPARLSVLGLGLALTLTLTLTLGGCGGGEQPTANGGEQGTTTEAPLKIGYSDWPGWVPWQVALEKGWFEEEGVAVDFQWFDYGASLDAFAAGSLDAVCATNGDALVIGAGGQPSTAVVLNDYSNGNDMIIAKSGIDSIQDLQGMKVGVEEGFVCHLLLLKALEENGMTEDDVEIVNIPTNELPNALKSGDVDAIGAWQPSSGQALEQVPGSTALFTSAEVPGLIYDLLYVDRQILEERREDWTKVTKVWYRIVDFINDPANEQEFLQIVSSRVGLTPQEYAPKVEGTKILTAQQALERLTGSPDEGLDSLMGSNREVDQFNVKYGVYAEPESDPAYFDPSFTQAIVGQASDAPATQPAGGAY